MWVRSGDQFRVVLEEFWCWLSVEGKGPKICVFRGVSEGESGSRSLGIALWILVSPPVFRSSPSPLLFS